MNKKIERLITAGMIAGLVVVFFYQVVYGVESGGYPIAHRHLEKNPNEHDLGLCDSPMNI